MCDEETLVVGRVQRDPLPHAITITIVDSSGLDDTGTSLVASVEPQEMAEAGQEVLEVGDGTGRHLEGKCDTHKINSKKFDMSDEEVEDEEAEEEEEEEEEGEEEGLHCLVCNLALSMDQADQHVAFFKSVTTATNRKMPVLLGTLAGCTITSRKAHSDFVCRRCFNLLDRIDALEVEMKETKEEIVSKYQETVAVYGGRARRRKPTTVRKKDYVFPKIEPEDEAEQLVEADIDENFEPKVEDLMEEEQDRQEEDSQDDEWEPEFKRPRVKREQTEFGPPKRKRGRPRKDSYSRQKMSVEEAASLSFEIVNEATSRGKPRLVDNKGYSYTRGRGTSGVVSWRCTVRNSKIYCKATVRQNGTKFLAGWERHCHTPNEEALAMARAVSRINREMKARPDDTPSQVVMEVISSEFGTGCVDEANLAKLVRRAQYQKRLLRPKNSSSCSDIRENEPAPWTFEVVDDATRRGKPRLLDNRGYSYTQTKNSSRGTTVWRCTIRNAKVYCRATVRQTGFMFVCGAVDHCHQPDSAALLKAKFTCKLNKEIKARPHESAASIVKKVMSTEFAAQNPSPLKISNLVRSVNYQRKASRPKDPTALDFELNEASLPYGFLKADILIAGRRHLIFMSASMASVLSQAHTWYCDTGLPVVSGPFTQLLAIQAFVRAGTSCKLQPLALIWMSDSRKEDYAAIFLKIMELLPVVPNVNKMVLGFEAGLWLGVQDVMPHLTLQGCHLSFNQVVWEKMRELDLIPSYYGIESTRKFCRQVMALPFLPVAEIRPMFGEFAESTEDSSQCYKDLINFIGDFFVENPVFLPSLWSVYEKPIRTTGDLEGWHKRLALKTSKRQLGFYQLVSIICKESHINESQVCLVTEEELLKHQKAKYARMQAKVFDHWESLAKQEISALDLLNEVAEFNGPDETAEETFPLMIEDSLCKTEVLIE